VVTQVKTNEISEQIIADTRKRAAAGELALAKFKAPRAISSEERHRIAEKMKQFADQKYAGLIGSGVVDA
jgi:hypothetical protein